MNRRHVLLLAGGGCAGLVLLAWRPPRPAPFGFGPVFIGMEQNAALKALRPGAFSTALCSGVDGVLFDWPDEGFRIPGGAPVPAMAMFGGPNGVVSEIEASVSFPDGGWRIEEWRRFVTAQVTELERRVGTVARETQSGEDDFVVEQVLSWGREEGEVSLQARWMRRSGAAFTRMHWIAAGATSVIV